MNEIGRLQITLDLPTWFIYLLAAFVLSAGITELLKAYLKYLEYKIKKLEEKE